MARGGGHAWKGACMAGGVNGRGRAWQGACMAGGMLENFYQKTLDIRSLQIMNQGTDFLPNISSFWTNDVTNLPRQCLSQYVILDFKFLS